MKIGYLNPWENAAENQAYRSLALAAAKLGIELVDCRLAEHVEENSPEFVISVASSIPKPADCPTYLTLHEPRKRFLEHQFYLKNFATYDGYLTISDQLERFAYDLGFAVGRNVGVGFYYNTPQTSAVSCDIEKLARSGSLRIGYFGTNWDRRLPGLFRTLDAHGILQIHGPSASWISENYKSYAGPLPFDGTAPQRAYASYGIGLVLLSADHLDDNLVSNRIFEIASVGAAAICPDIPWIRRWFGDSVFYYDPRRSIPFIAAQIDRHFAFCTGNPDLVQERAARARAIFEEHFCAEVMLENAVAYHEKVQDACKRQRARLKPEPEISVIIRCGGRPVEDVEAAVESIRRQTFGRFAVIFSQFRELDLNPIVSNPSDRINSFTRVLTPGGDRYSTLCAGLAQVETEYFAMLDDDDFWLSDHVETLFEAGRLVDPDFDCAFSATVCVTRTSTQIETSLWWNRNIYTFGFHKVPDDATDLTSNFASNCFVAKSRLVPDGFANLPGLETAEDSLLIALVTRHKRPVFSYKATAFFRRGWGSESAFETLSSRDRDLLSMRMRSSLVYGPSWLVRPSIQPALEAWSEFTADRNEPASLTETLGEPELRDDPAETWDITERMKSGTAGRRISEREIEAVMATEGHVCYGPYLPLPAGRFGVEFSIAWQTAAVGLIEAVLGRLLRQDTKQPEDLAAVDVVVSEAGWEGAAKRVEAGEGKVLIEFEVPDGIAGKPIEFRLWSSGRAALSITSVRLLRY